MGGERNIRLKIRTLSQTRSLYYLQILRVIAFAYVAITASAVVIVRIAQAFKCERRILKVCLGETFWLWYQRLFISKNDALNTIHRHVIRFGTSLCNV